MYMLFFFNDTATTEIYTLSLHDALPISVARQKMEVEELKRLHEEKMREQLEPVSEDGPVYEWDGLRRRKTVLGSQRSRDRKSTRLNSSHANISYAVFCLKKKK